nr:MAG TPA: hypothetical protein [Caudoviricetes sp.]
MEFRFEALVFRVSFAGVINFYERTRNEYAYK